MSELVRERKLNECIINLPQTQIQLKALGKCVTLTQLRDG